MSDLQYFAPQERRRRRDAEIQAMTEIERLKKEIEALRQQRQAVAPPPPPPPVNRPDVTMPKSYYRR